MRLIARGAAHAGALARGRALRSALDQALCEETAALADGAEVGLLPAGDRGLNMATPRVSIQTADFDLGAEVSALRAADPGVGAVASFVGTVRDRNDGCGVSAMELEHYPGMTEKAIEAMIDEALRRFDIRAARVIHRVGPLAPLDQIVLVAVTSAHRGGLPGLRVPDGLPEDAGAVLEEGAHASGRTLGRCPRQRRRGAGTLGHRCRQRRAGRVSGVALWLQVLAVAAGAAAGALARWGAGLWLNARWAGFPLGTLFFLTAAAAVRGAMT
jgi:molybdopterin synthase catalytic subunit